MEICEWAQCIMRFAVTNKVGSEMIGGKTAVSAN